MQICKKMQKCKKLKSTQKCKLKNKIGHQLLVQKSELGRGFRDFRPCFFSQTFCLTKAYNFCHQVALVDGPMRRDVAIIWTNRKRDGAVWACATQINQCTEFVDAYDDDIDVR